MRLEEAKKDLAAGKMKGRVNLTPEQKRRKARKAEHLKMLQAHADAKIARQVRHKAGYHSW